MEAAGWLHHVLEIESPWQVVDASYDRGTRRIDIWVGAQPERKGWFARPKPATSDGRERVWRHVNLGTVRCFVHVRAATGASAALPWCGDEEMPFTRAMSRQVVALLSDGIKFPAICALLDVQLTDLWKFKFGLDSGRTGLAAAAILSDTRTPGGRPAGAFATSLPDLADPVWESLLDGAVDVDIRVLSLKLLLTKLQDQMRVIKDPEVRMLKKHEVYRYFVRHEKVLGHELAQLRKH